MTTIAQVAMLDAEIAALTAKREAIISSDQYKVEHELHAKLQALMAELGKSVSDVVALVKPEAESKPARKRRTRAEMVYKNPNTGEVVKTQGATHRTLREWRDQYGAETVAAWRQEG